MGYGVKEISRLGPAAQQQILRELLAPNRGKGANAPAKESEQKEIRFTIPLNPVTKKNSQRVIPCGKYHKVLPSKAYERYEKEAEPFLPVCGRKISRPCEVVGLFYMKNRHKVDLTNLLEALDDVLVAHEVLEDDNSQIIVSHDGSRVLHDPANPRTEVTIRFLEEQEEQECLF